MRPRLLPKRSRNHTDLSGPIVNSPGLLFGVGIAYSVILPSEVMRAILLPLPSANQAVPLAPLTMPNGALLAVGMVYSVITSLAKRVAVGAGGRSASLADWWA